jgi:hypothetical protein
MTKATNKATTVKAAGSKANSEVIKGATVETTAAVVANSEVIKAPTKADKGREIMAECYADMTKVPARKDIIGRLVAEAALTPAGAATYLQNFKSKNGLTQKALAAKAEPATA